eukprot:CAMPEP_0183484926 /NCGR_PEP_ID=MMETSP0370-20130417/179169_1 /TAXON_ID=268820 /ORGANISM="Peridinium aciculiferum, Strain PAER-2" /LENGTH=174 /DNA_ID=CAMNT_0025678221 /DNA_START=662 /DNA_END=1187 /DNA_ORIENTATION=+
MPEQAQQLEHSETKHQAERAPAAPILLDSTGINARMPEQVQQLEHSETKHQARKGTCCSSHDDSPDTAKGEIQRSVQAKAKNAMRPNQSVHPCPCEPSKHNAASAQHLRERRVLLHEAAEVCEHSLEGQGVEAQDDSKRLLDGDEQVIHLLVEAVPHGELLRTGCPDEVLRGVK